MPDRADRSGRIEKELFLRTLQLGRFGPVAEAMAARMRTQLFGAGATLYREGEAAQTVYFIRSGEIVLRKEGQEPWSFGARDVIGILDVMQDRARDRSAEAVTDTVVLAVSGEDWFELLEDNYEVTRRAVTGVAMGMYDLGLRLPPTGGFPPPAPDDTEARPIRSFDTVERIIALREAPLLAKANVQPLIALSATLEERRLAAGEVLFRAGEPSSAFFLIARGLVEVAREDPTLRAGFGPGAVVGGYGALAHTVQPFDAVARIPSLVFRVGLEQYWDVMEDHFELARSLLAAMAQAREHVMRRIADRARLGGEASGESRPSIPGARVVSSAG